MEMLAVKGKYGTAKVYAKTVEQSALDQIKTLMDQESVDGSNIAIMPDTHSGAGCVIGFTQTIKDKVIPNLVGVDIGCGMLAVKISKEFKIDLEKFDKIVHEKIVSGRNIRDVEHSFVNKIDFSQIKANVNVDYAKKSLATTGGGNHFIEIDVDSNGDQYIVIHSGSRHLGVEIAHYYQDKAVLYHKYHAKQILIDKLKSEGREKEIQKELKLLSNTIPKELAYLEGEDMQDYLHDMKIAQQLAMWSREGILFDLLSALNIDDKFIMDKFCTMHNYIDLDNMILRKGAISLQKDEIAIIPMNMREGSLIVKGKGNKEWNYSGPHGAGRLMSRKEAHAKLSMDEFKQSMEGIYTTCVNESTIDESPMAYKPMQEIVECIKDTADIIEVIKPIYNYKSST